MNSYKTTQEQLISLKCSHPRKRIYTAQHLCSRKLQAAAILQVSQRCHMGEFRQVSISARQRSLRCVQNLRGSFLRATLPNRALETTGRVVIFWYTVPMKYEVYLQKITREWSRHCKYLSMQKVTRGRSKHCIEVPRRDWQRVIQVLLVVDTVMWFVAQL